MCYASWCQHCKNMKEKVFTDSSVADFYNHHFVCTKMDMEKGDGSLWSKKFGVKSYPTFVFLDTSGQRFYQTVGEFQASDFIQEGKNALTPEKQLPYLQHQFELNPSDSDRCYQYLRALRKANLEVDELMQSYFSYVSTDHLITVMNWKIISLGVTDPRSREIQFLLSHQKEFAAISSPFKVAHKIYLTAAGSIEPAADNNDTATYFRNRSLVQAWHLDPVDSLIFELDLMLYDNNKNYTAYEKTALEYTEKYYWNDYVQLRHIADIFLKQVQTISSLKRAAVWAQRSTILHEEYGNALLYAKLLNKSGDTAAAKEEAEKAIAIAAKVNMNASEAEQLVQQLR